MKIHRVVTMLGATTTTGKLASDMYDLNDKTYYSEAEGRDIPISHMDFQHMVRAFVKQNDEDIRNDTQEGKIVDIVKAKDSIIKGLRSQVETLSENIGSLKEQLEEKDQEYMDYTAKIERQRDMYRNMANEVHRTNGCAYIFCEVPQDDKGREFTKNCREYLNTESYTIRVRGQHLKKDLYGQGRASWGANMEDSSHMRVYIDKKKGDK